jgi:hypothetical protein
LSWPFGLAFDSASDLFEADTGSDKINEFVNNSGVLSTNPTVFASRLNRPTGLAFNGAGDLFEADWGSGNIYEFINNGGNLSTNPTVFASGLVQTTGLAFQGIELPIPEPSTWALVGLGLSALLVFRRRKA